MFQIEQTEHQELPHYIILHVQIKIFGGDLQLF